MIVPLADIIDVLDAAYPPRLAQDWDSVGLVCGDPAETVETVTVAVDATAAVVAEVPDRGLRWRITHAVARRRHRCREHGQGRPRAPDDPQRALFTAHTNADAASPGVSDALADALGLTVEEVLAGLGGSRPGQVGGLRAAENAAPCGCDVRAGAGHIGDYSHCSWSVSGTGQFLPLDGASPTIGSVGTVERVPEDRVEVIAPTRQRAHVLAAMRAAHPYEEPAFDVFALAAVPGDVGLGRVGALPKPEPLAAFVSRVHDALPGTSWGVRASGDSEATVSRVAVCGERATLLAWWRARACTPTSPRSAPPSRRRAQARVGCGPDRRRSLGQ
jgi:putative NIF3 family GTP cyclohydrolase 1 type 2